MAAQKIPPRKNAKPTRTFPIQLYSERLKTICSMPVPINAPPKKLKQTVEMTMPLIVRLDETQAHFVTPTSRLSF